MKTKNMKMILFFLLIDYLILLFDFELIIESGNTIRKIEYNGFIWVALDRYTIWRYESDDKPMCWLSYQKSMVNDTR